MRTIGAIVLSLTFLSASAWAVKLESRRTIQEAEEWLDNSSGAQRLGGKDKTASVPKPDGGSDAVQKVAKEGFKPPPSPGGGKQASQGGEQGGQGKQGGEQGGKDGQAKQGGEGGGKNPISALLEKIKEFLKGLFGGGKEKGGDKGGDKGGKGGKGGPSSGGP